MPRRLLFESERVRNGVIALLMVLVLIVALGASALYVTKTRQRPQRVDTRVFFPLIAPFDR